MMPRNREIEEVAQALYDARYKATNGAWSSFSDRKPDIAEIYRENARVAIEALDRIRESESRQ